MAKIESLSSDYVEDQDVTCPTDYTEPSAGSIVMLAFDEDGNDITPENNEVPVTDDKNLNLNFLDNDEEYMTSKRTYMLKNSTIRKILEIKKQHPNLAITMSQVVDIAISFYYENFNKNND